MTTKGTKQRRKPEHCFIFKATWRGTSLLLRIECNHLEAAYRKAEYEVKKMQGGTSCMGIECVKQVY